MPITYINTGTSPNAGNGDVLRLAFQKVNSNFQFLSTLTIAAITDQQLFTTSDVEFGDLVANSVTATNFIASKFYAPFGGPDIGGYAFEGTGNDTGIFGPSDDVVDIMARGSTIIRFFSNIAPAPNPDEIFIVPYGSIIPIEDMLCQLGATGRFWTGIYANTATVNRIVFSDNTVMTSTNAFFGNVNQDIIPSSDLAYDLGSTSSQWRSLYVGTSTIYIGGTALSVENGNLTLGGNTLQISSLTNSSSYLTIGPDDTVDFSGGLTFFSDGYNGTIMHESTFDSALAMMSHGNEVSSYVGMVWNREYTDVYAGTETSTWIWVDPSGAHVGCYVLNTSTYQVDVKLWQFNYNGDLIFPDGSIQDTAVNKQILGPLGQYAPSGTTARNKTFYAGSTGTFTASEVTGIDAGWYVFGFGLFNTVVQSVVIEDSFAYISINDGIFQPYQDYTFSTSSGTVTAIPSNAVGFLYNNGSGTLTWNNSAGGNTGDIIFTGTTISAPISSDIIIRSESVNLGIKDWIFAETGSLTVPMDIHGSGANALVIQNTSSGVAYLELPVDPSTEDVILANQDPGGVVTIRTGDFGLGSEKDWRFDANGRFILSSNLSIDPLGLYAPASGTRMWQKEDEYLEILSTGTYGGTALGWVNNFDNQQTAAIFANSPLSPEAIAIVVGSYTATLHSWVFDNYGNLTPPSGFGINHDGMYIGNEGNYVYIDIPSNANAHAYNEGLRFINNDGPISLYAGLQGGITYYWRFNTEGGIDFPDGTTSTGANIYVPYATSSSFKITTEWDISGAPPTYMPLSFEVKGNRIILPSGNGYIQSGEYTDPWSLDSGNKMFVFPNTARFEWDELSNPNTGSLTLNLVEAVDPEFHILLNQSGKRWKYKNNGGLEFPDGTTQTTAFTGTTALLDITNTNGLGTTYYPTFVENRSEGQIVRADVDLTYKTDTNTLSVGNFTATNTITVGGILDTTRGVHETFVTSTTATTTATYDCSTSQIFYHATTGTVANWTANLTNLSLSSGKATSVNIIIKQGNTGYYPSAVQIGGVGQTLNWQGNTNPTVTANRTDVVTFSILNNGGTYLVLGQLTGF